MAKKDFNLSDIEESEGYFRARIKSPNLFSSFRTIDISEDLGIKAIYGKYKFNLKWGIQSYLFDINKWNIVDVKNWLNEHKDRL